jgi:diguanylate cyclase (GGDEF)-like protein
MKEPKKDLPQAKILVVDDTVANLVAMRHLLAKVDARLFEARSGNDALALCLDNEFALILLDVQMPDMDGFEVATLLSEEARTRDTPIIFVTAAFADDLNRMKGYKHGAVDYIAKPINDAILLSKVRVFLELYRDKQALKQMVGLLEKEVAERKRLEELARHQATHDALTGLPNRHLFMDRLSQAVERSLRHLSPFALLYIDIDGFKPVNDRHGHQVGDELLKGIATRLTQSIRRSDTAARVGGDEFAVIMEETAEVPGTVQAFGEKLCNVLAEPYTLAAGGDTPIEVTISASIGVSLFPADSGDGSSPDEVIRAADTAMYRAKKAGKNRVVMADDCS